MTTPYDPYSANSAFPIVPQSPIPGNAIASSSMTINTSQMNFASYTANTGMFGYTGIPGSGQLFFSVSPASGSDVYGNSYGAGLTVTQGNLNGMTVIGSSLDSTSMINGSTLNNVTSVQPSITGGTATSTLHVVNTSGGGVYSYSQNSTTVTFASQTVASWTCPTGVTHAQVQCWAAGGGGDGGTTVQGGGGGGAGEYAAEPSLTVIPAQVYTVIVGGGGGGGSTGVGGAAGSNTIFGSNLVFANAGGAGNNGAGGPGGTGSSNTIHNDGGAGGDNFPAFSGAAGGGGAGDVNGAGSAGTDPSGSSGAGGGADGGGGAGGAGGAGGGNGSNGVNGTGAGGGGGGAGEGTSSNTTTNVYYATRSVSYYGSQVGSGKRADSNSGNGTMYQGCASGELSTTGDQYSFAVFPYAQMESDLSGATINHVYLQLKNLHSWYDSGCYVIMGWVTYTTFGSTGSLVGAHENAQSFWIDEGSEVNQSVINGWGTVFQSDSATAILFGPSGATAGGATDLYNYGYFYGADGSSKSPALTITFTTSGSGSTNAGDGADGEVQITYTASSSQILNASISASATPVTDTFGNTIPQGVMTSNLVAIQPSSSPIIPEVWHNFTLNTGFSTSGSSWNSDPPYAQYKLLSDGSVRLRGLINIPAGDGPGGNTWKQLTGTPLPVGYRPSSSATMVGRYFNLTWSLQALNTGSNNDGGAGILYPSGQIWVFGGADTTAATTYLCFEATIDLD